MTSNETVFKDFLKKLDSVLDAEGRSEDTFVQNFNLRDARQKFEVCEMYKYWIICMIFLKMIQTEL